MTNKKRQPQGEPPRPLADREEKAIRAQANPRAQVQKRYLGHPGKTSQNPDTHEKSKPAPLKTKVRHPQPQWRRKTASTVSGAQQKARERNGPATGKRNVGETAISRWGMLQKRGSGGGVYAG